MYTHSQSQRRRTKGKELPKIAASLGASAASQRSVKRETRPGRSLLEDRKPVQLNGESKEEENALLDYGKKKTLDLETRAKHQRNVTKGGKQRPERV